MAHDSATRLALGAALLALLAAPSHARPARHPAPPGDLLVVNQRQHALVRVDLATGRVRGSAELGVNGHELLVSPDERLAFVPIYGDSGLGRPGSDGATIDIVDIAQMRRIFTIDLGEKVRPHDIHYGPGGLLWVTAELAEAIFIVDPGTRRLVGRVPTGKPQSHMLAFSPDLARAYTANFASGTVSVIDTRRRRLLRTIPVGGRLQRITVAPDGTIFTHDVDRPRIARISPGAASVSSWIALPGSAYASAVTPDGRYLVIASPDGDGSVKGRGAIYLVELATGRLAHSFDLAGAPSGVRLSADGASAFFPCPSAGKIVRLDLATMQLRPDLQLASGVDGLAPLQH
jgi:YVTN family beta-propeller protein